MAELQVSDRNLDRLEEQLLKACQETREAIELAQGPLPFMAIAIAGEHARLCKLLNEVRDLKPC